MDHANERTPLNGSVPVATAPARSRTRSQSRLTKMVLSGALALALVLAIYLSSRPSRGKPNAHAATASTGGAASSAALMNGSAPWSCGATPYDAGYIKLPNKKDDYYFYWFVESSSTDPSKDPLVLWLTGGPGASSMSALLTENGPCTINDDLTTKPNPFSWTQKANVIWLDQPTGVGFSYSNAPQDDADRDEHNVGQNIYWFLQGFLEKHPEFDGREFFITGESYGGHYVPGAAHFIWEENQKKAKGRKQINLQGIAIGNGHTDPVIQYQHFADMAENKYNISLLSDEQVVQMRAASVECIAYTQKCQKSPGNGTACVDAVACWSSKLLGPFSAAHRNSYDLRKSCTQEVIAGAIAVCGFDFSIVQKYLDQPPVRKALNVNPSITNWTALNNQVSTTFVASGDWSISYSSYVADLLNGGIRVLIYAGDADLVCNWAGNQAWTLALDWSGKDGFNAASEHPFIAQVPVDSSSKARKVNVDAGVARSFGNFTFLRVFEAGHMVPTDQPAVSLDMINKFLKNMPL